MLPIVQKFYKEVVQDMDNNKLDTITNLFEEKEIRSIWNSEKEDYFFSVVDVVSALTDSNDPAHYWRTLKSRMLQEGNETVTNCDTFKLKAKDGKMRNTDMLDTQNILRLIESIPSPKAEPFKMWLASLGNERINEVFDFSRRKSKLGYRLQRTKKQADTSKVDLVSHDSIAYLPWTQVFQ